MTIPRGRKPLPEEEKRNNPVQVTFTDEEYEFLTILAKQHHMSAPALLRDMFLDIMYYRHPLCNPKYPLEALDRKHFSNTRQEISNLLKFISEKVLEVNNTNKNDRSSRTAAKNLKELKETVSTKGAKK